MNPLSLLLLITWALCWLNCVMYVRCLCNMLFTGGKARFLLLFCSFKPIQQLEPQKRGCVLKDRLNNWAMHGGEEMETGRGRIGKLHASTLVKVGTCQG